MIVILCVTPRAGVWIETHATLECVDRLEMSLPVRECGLNLDEITDGGGDGCGVKKATWVNSVNLTMLLLLCYVKQSDAWRKNQYSSSLKRKSSLEG